MAIWKKLRCPVDGHEQRVGKGGVTRKPPPCPKCGGPREYSENWYVSLQVDGKPYVRSVSTRWEDADNHQTEIKSRRMKGELVANFQKYTFDDAVKEYEIWMAKNKRVTDVSKATYKTALARVKKFLGPRKLTSLDHEVFEELMEDLEHREYAPATINASLTAASIVLNVAVKKKMIRYNPMIGLAWAATAKGSERFLSQEECSRLLEAAGKANSHGGYVRMMILLSLHTGLRRHGCESLRWDEIDFVAGTITKVVKGGVEVTIPITTVLRSELMSYWQQRKVVSPYLFPVRNKPEQHVSRYCYAYQRALELAGLDDGTVVFHTLRHTFATHYIMATKDIHMLAGILGHSNAYITERYAHRCDDRKRESMKVFEEQTYGKKTETSVVTTW